MIARFILLLITFSFCALPGTAQHKLPFWDGEETYLWPTDASRYASSSFGETRSAHFHAALDIKTWGKRGYKVFATRDAILHRVAVGPEGYGKVVYLKHTDGSFSVYAHLLDFESSIRQLVDSLRLQTYSFVFDQNLERFNIRFDRGDVIGYSGASGVGPPHLHFELRTPSHKPFNPLLTNLSIPDSRPPQLQALSVEPLHYNSLIEGHKRILTRAPRIRNGVYDFGSINVQGAVGLGINAFDQADKVHNVYAVYELELSLDDKMLFSSRVDSFSYSETNQMFLDRVYPILKKTRKGYQRMYVVDGNTLPFYKKTNSKGVLDLPDGSHTLRITARDFFGNTSRAKVTLNVGKPSTHKRTKSTKQSVPFVQRNKSSIPTPSVFENWYWHNNWVSIPGNFNPVSVTHFGSFTGSKTLYNETKKMAVPLGNDSEMLEAGDHQLTLHRIIPGHNNTMYSADQRVSAAFQPQSLFDTLSAGIMHQSNADSIRVYLFPNHEPVKDTLQLRYVLSNRAAKDSTLAWYYLHPRKQQLNYQPSTKIKSELIGKVRSFGQYYILPDHAPPQLNAPKIYKREDGHWIATIHVKDNLSGIDFKSAKFYCNNRRGIAEYDPETNHLIYYHPDFEPAKQNNIKVEVSDMVGNTVKKSYTLRR